MLLQRCLCLCALWSLGGGRLPNVCSSGRFEAWALVPLQGATAGCRCQMPTYGSTHIGTWALTPLQGAEGAADRRAWSCTLWSLGSGAAAERHCLPTCSARPLALLAGVYANIMFKGLPLVPSRHSGDGHMKTQKQTYLDMHMVP